MQALKWNADKKHRCPKCHAVTVDMDRPQWWLVYECCMCGVFFCRFPRLAWLLPFAGIMCSDHREED